MRKVGFLLFASLVALIPSQVHATHIFSTNITINGKPVAAGNAFTNPTITVKQGATVTFSFDLFSTFGDPDTFKVNFTGAGLPANQSFAYNGSGTSGTPLNFSFNQVFNTPGTFSGFLQPDFPVSFPDYIFPGGNQTNAPQIPFTIQVDAIPEPASMTIFGMMAVGGAFYGWRRRKLAAAV